jgi:S-formylglutathione hydrolase
MTKELPKVISTHFHVNIARSAITGFSMGGLGALLIALKNPGMFKSVSAFAPIADPSNSKWGSKAFTNFFGSVEGGKDYDPT